ncbi:hypothetical protein SAY87_021126 [Trapa incisa]|uniref:cyclic pyranopterin monophosphate synthase n=1 Tax=Trapa incisa TaxID=236973 RepID=A0AAN7PR36_9MYRT|nr:hypothetical protein SAY87_021126 [Trapa incisa]
MYLRPISQVFSSSRRLFSNKSSPDLASAINELNKEMEAVFGQPPPPGFGSSSASYTDSSGHSTVQEIHYEPNNSGAKDLHGSEGGLTHVGGSGEAQMVDVSQKSPSKRTAIASCKVLLGKKVFHLVSANQLAKGDVLSVARLAGITGAKSTSSLIPLCHNIMLSHVRVDLKLNSEDCSVEIEGEAASTGKTGVEMEALTAVSVAGLTVYDMCKAASKDIEISSVRLESKTGGKSGDWLRKG